MKNTLAWAWAWTLADSGRMSAAVSRLSVLVMLLVLAGCGREVDTLTAIGFDRPRPDQFLAVTLPPLVQPPDFDLLPPRSEAVEDVAVDSIVPASQVRWALLQAFSQLDDNVRTIRDLHEHRSPEIPATISPAMEGFLRYLGVGKANAAIRDEVDRLTTGLTAEYPWVVLRLSGRDKSQDLATPP